MGNEHIDLVRQNLSALYLNDLEQIEQQRDDVVSYVDILEPVFHACTILEASFC